MIGSANLEIRGNEIFGKSKNSVYREIRYIEKFSTGGCLLSREKAVKDVNSRVGFCFLVGIFLNFDWSIFSWPIQIENKPD